MKSRAPLAQRSIRGARWTTAPAALGPALALLLAALVMCLGYGAHGAVGGHASPVTAMAGASSAQAPADGSIAYHTTSSVHQNDCPAGEVCCTSAIHLGGTVPVAPVQPAPAVLPRTPRLPEPPAGPPLLASRPLPDEAPDLHVLQVQRT
ncbi:hypothetical protein ACFWR9_27820 [Streptomyces sp. NPDC058534]|uniref:hypothetical protein n=1 Tax=Streptomyces sp. NPDC058534 TaxID=3346541 RepID=UPI0036527C08